MKRFTTSDGLSLAYRDDGDGPAVLCLAGLTRNMADFDDLAGAMGDELRLIRMDYRGRGASDHDPDPANYAIPVEARDAVELLDHLGVDRVAIIGTSRGGLIAMALATLHKVRLAGVVLNDVGPVIDRAGLEFIRNYIGRDPDFKTYDDAADQLPIINAAIFPGVSRDRWRQLAQRWWDQGKDGLKITYDPKLAQSVHAALNGPEVDLWPFFDALDGVPLALLRGENSNLLSEDTAAEMSRRRPDMIFETIPDRGHVPFLDEQKSIAAIRTLIAATDQTRPR